MGSAFGDWPVFTIQERKRDTEKMSKEIKFEKAAFGYRPEDVDRYIAETEKKLAAAKSEKAELLGKMKILADKITEYRSDESNIKEAMLGAQRMKTNIENEAKSKADSTVAEAQQYADKLIADAQARAGQLITEAQERSNKMLADAQAAAEAKVNGVTSQVERERETLAQLQKEVSGFKNRLITLYREHLNLITNLPEKAEKAPAPKASAPAPAPAPKAAAQPAAAEPQEEEYEFNSGAFKEKFGEVKLD